MSARYPIRAVSRLTGIEVDTLRAWERRYRAVTPARSDRGRVYSEAEVRRLRLLRAAVDAGHAIGRVAALSNKELTRLAGAAAAHLRPSDPDHVDLDPLLALIEKFDYLGANAELSRLALLLHAPDLVYRAVLPLLRVTGDRWEHGEFSIAQEHLLSACLRNLLGGLVRLQRPARRHPVVLLTTPAGELHEFAILAAAMLAASNEFRVAYLGPNLPAREILSAWKMSGADFAALSITSGNAAAARSEIAAILKAMPAGAELWIGGSGAGEAARRVRSSRLVILETLQEFEARLSRWKSVRAAR